MEKNSNIALLESRLASIEAEMKPLYDKINVMKREQERVLVAIEVVQSLSKPEPEQVKNKPTPIREYIMSMFDANDALTVQQVYDGLKDKVATGKPSINTTLSILVKKGELAKRGIGLYCLP